MTSTPLPAIRMLSATLLTGGPPLTGGGFNPGSLRMHAPHVLVPSGRTIDVVNMHPDPNALPGGQVLQNLMNGLDSWALALALVGLVVGAAAWALGSHGQNYQQSFVGRRAVLISGLAALLIGAGPGLVSFFFNAGSGVH